MTDFDERYCALRRAVIELEFSRLNDRQKDGVFKTEGPVLILAGAGSGKTTVLINRIINLLRYGRAYECEEAPAFAGDNELSALLSCLSGDEVPDEEILRLCAVDPPKPYEIIAITFTNKAANELRSRLELACGDKGREIWAHTFHSACSRILRSHIEKIGYKSNFTIYDEDDRKKALSAVFSELSISERSLDPKFVSREISRAKDSLLSPESYAETAGKDPMRRAAAEVYARYEEYMKSLNALDFDDIIVKTVELLKACPDVLDYYQNKFKYVLVDEYQDTNHAQYVLCSLLSGKHRNLCVVGDDDQSIYKFRGATIKNILDFENEYPDALTIRLEQNYRSTASILSAANGVISNNLGRKGKNLWTQSGDGDPVCLYTGNTQEDEAEFICRTVLNGITSGARFSDYCVLYRNHALSNGIENGLKRNGIPYRIVSGLRFFDRAEVKDMLAFLSVVNNPSDAVRLKRIINVPPRGIGAVTQEKIAQIAAEENIPAFDVMKNAPYYLSLEKAALKLKAFTDMIDSFSSAKKDGLMTLYERILKETGYEEMLKELPRAEKEVKLDNVLELKSNIADYESRTEEPSLNGFLEEISLFTDVDRYDENADAVTLMTIHSAKGLEFENVFICGAEEGLFPSYRSDTEELLEEERRLCYVAITRAKKRLYITCAEQRMLYGQTTYSLPSRFIGEIPESLTRKIGGRRAFKAEIPFAEKRSNTKSAFDGVFGAKLTEKPQKGGAFNYKTGQRIRHKTFGDGTVAELTPMGNDVMLRIIFDNCGEKLMMGKSASAHITAL